MGTSLLMNEKYVNIKGDWIFSIFNKTSGSDIKFQLCQ